MKTSGMCANAVEEAFGEPACEVVGLLSSLAKTLSQLEALFSYLESDLGAVSPEQGVPPRVRALVAAGLQLSGLSAGMAESRVLEYRAALAQAGVWQAPTSG